MSSPREAQLPLLLSISEGLSRGTDEMLRVSPQGDAIHPPSCSLAIRESVEEIKWLRAEVERLRAALRDIERGDYSDPMCERTVKLSSAAWIVGLMLWLVSSLLSVAPAIVVTMP